MKRKKDYKSRGEKFFLEYLPQEVFDSFKPKEREDYKKYRDNHRYMFNGKNQIKKWEEEISKLRKKIKDKKSQINGDGEYSGWKEKMMIGYEGIQKYSKDFQFNISIGFQTRTPKILKNQKDLEEGKRGRKKDMREQTHFKGKLIKPSSRMVIRLTRTKDVHKNFHGGSEEDVRMMIGNLYKEDWSKESLENLKYEVRILYSTYIRYHVFHSNWKEFMLGKHSLSNVIEWSKKMGDKRYDW